MVYPALSLAMARRYTRSMRFKVETAALENSERVMGLTLDRMQILTDKYGRVLIPYSGHRGGVPYISATDVLQASADDQFPQLNEAAVLVGPPRWGWRT